MPILCNLDITQFCAEGCVTYLVGYIVTCQLSRRQSMMSTPPRQGSRPRSGPSGDGSGRVARTNFGAARKANGPCTSQARGSVTRLCWQTSMPPSIRPISQLKDNSLKTKSRFSSSSLVLKRANTQDIANPPSARSALAKAFRVSSQLRNG